MAKRVAKKWVPSWVLNPVVKALPPSVAPKTLVHAKKPAGIPIDGGEWVQVKVTELPSWLPL